MGCILDTIRTCKIKVARAFKAGVLAGFVAVMPAIAQSPQADFDAGKSYHDGDGVPQDYVRARSLYERAADNGNIDAMINLGYIYYVGEGIEQNYDKARDWYIRAERLGSLLARNNLDGLYSRGLSSPPAISEISELEIISQNVVSEDAELEELAGKPNIKTPEPEAMLEPEPKLELELELEPEAVAEPDMSTITPSIIDNDEALAPPPETPQPDIMSTAETPESGTGESRTIESGTVESETYDALSKAQNSAKPSFKLPSFSIAKLIPYLIGFGVFLCLLGIIGIIRFMTAGPRRFVESFMHAHDYGLRRMYSHFLQTSRSPINRENWLGGVSDMIVRHAHDEAIAAAHTKQTYPLQEAAKDTQQAARIASASLARRAEKLIIKSYKRLGAPD